MGQEQGLHRACLLAVRRLPDAIKQLTCLHMFNRQDGESADATGFLHIFATQQEEVAAAAGRGQRWISTRESGPGSQNGRLDSLNSENHLEVM